MLPYICEMKKYGIDLNINNINAYYRGGWIDSLSYCN
jgi:hypothetical protein